MMDKQDITWQDMLIAEDALIEALTQKLNDDPEHGEYWCDLTLILSSFIHTKYQRLVLLAPV